MKDKIQSSFISQYGKSPEHFIYAPGRANIIGEHTDYNDGFVMPFAITHGIWFCGRINPTTIINIKAIDTNETATIELGTNEVSADFGWLKFFLQVLKAMSPYDIKGADIVFGGNLPIGAGISSSSAITCGFTALLDRINQFNLVDSELVQVSVNAERGYGVRGGIMDQFSIFNGKKNQAILLDCKTNHAEYLPMNLGDYNFYLFNTKVQHNLLHTDYNSRRSECELAVSLINQHYRKIESLRDIGKEDLIILQSMLDDVLFNRVRFVVQENSRVLQVKDAFLNNNLPSIGTLLYESHDGLSQMYQVSCEELDWLVAYTLQCDQIEGGRMMGGGFGGCTINLVKGNLAENVIDNIKINYKDRFGFFPDVFEVSPSDGILSLR